MPRKVLSTHSLEPVIHPFSYSGNGEFRIIRSNWVWGSAQLGSDFSRRTGLRYDFSSRSYEYVPLSFPAMQSGDNFYECETDGMPSREIAVLENRPYSEDNNFIRIYDRDTLDFIRLLMVPQNWILQQCVDLDGDGLDDMLLRGSYPNEQRFLALRGYDGARIGQVEVRGPGAVRTFIVGQFDHDPSLEIFVTHGSSAGSWCSIADFQTGRYVSHFTGHWRTLRVADVNFDGRDELIVGRFEGHGSFSYVDCWDLARWWRLWSVPMGYYPILDVADLDGNGTVEVITTYQRECVILHGGTGLPARRFTLPSSRGTVRSVKAADPDRDGRSELVWEMDDRYEGYLMITDAEWGQKEWEERGFFEEMREIELGDLNHDGNLDALVIDGGADWYASLGVLDPITFEDRSSILDRSDHGITGCRVGDVDRDGADEAVVVEAGPNYPLLTQLKIYRWNGQQMVATWSAWDASWNAYEGEFVDLLDLEMDGDLEILVGMNDAGVTDRGIRLLAIVDYPSGAMLRQWPVDLLGARLIDHDEDGVMEILGIDRQGLVLLDPRTGVIEDRLSFNTATTIEVSKRNGHGLVVMGTRGGLVNFLESSPQGLRRSQSIRTGNSPVTAAAYDKSHDLLISVADGAALVHDASSGAKMHASKRFLFNFGRKLQILPGARPAFLISDDYNLYRFDLP